MSDITSKLDKLHESLKDGRPDQVAIVERMQRTLKRAMLKKNFAEHPALIDLLNVLRKREGSYTLLLSNKEDLTQEERTRMYAQRKEVRFILSFFDGVDKTISTLEKELDFQLSDEGVDSSKDSE